MTPHPQGQSMEAWRGLGNRSSGEQRTILPPRRCDLTVNSIADCREVEISGSPNPVDWAFLDERQNSGTSKLHPNDWVEGAKLTSGQSTPPELRRRRLNG